VKEQQGVCIMYKGTRDRWGGLYETERGAIASYNKTRGVVIMHESGRRAYWHEQDVLEIVPLFSEYEWD
jgi:hypothetical protein